MIRHPVTRKSIDSSQERQCVYVCVLCLCFASMFCLDVLLRCFSPMFCTRQPVDRERINLFARTAIMSIGTLVSELPNQGL